MNFDDLIEKYNQPGPRYTSYPTVPHWQEAQMPQTSWMKHVQHGYWQSHREISLYIHLPFCESLCTYCGCNTRITKNHGVELVYISALLKEWKIYLNSFPVKPILKELHLGGGTPTFFSAENLEFLISNIQADCIIPDKKNYSFEGHPNNTTRDHLLSLYRLGFNRVSFGIQDFDPNVQQLINRIQLEVNVAAITYQAREIGYESINFDLIYGLPGQTLQTLENTLDKTIAFNPSRIAFYSYAHVPWLKPAQKSYEDSLPSPKEKMALYQFGKRALVEAGYFDIGMDHFALADDDLKMSADHGSLHRNFMGYTTQDTKLTLGLGVSAVSDTWTAFSQNVKDLNAYYKSIAENKLPISKGHMLNSEDLSIRKHILNLMCRYQTEWKQEEFETLGFSFNIDLLENMQLDGLILFDQNGITITDKGRPFVRNVCMAIDARLNQKQGSRGSIFSKTI